MVFVVIKRARGGFRDSAIGRLHFPIAPGNGTAEMNEPWGRWSWVPRMRRGMPQARAGCGGPGAQARQAPFSDRGFARPETGADGRWEFPRRALPASAPGGLHLACAWEEAWRAQRPSAEAKPLLPRSRRAACAPWRAAVHPDWKPGSRGSSASSRLRQGARRRAAFRPAWRGSGSEASRREWQ
jgi:hypothetical protein